MTVSGFLLSGGVMLVHDIRNNESRIIDFRETAPSGIHEGMMLNLSQRVKLYLDLLSSWLKCVPSYDDIENPKQINQCKCFHSIFTVLQSLMCLFPSFSQVCQWLFQACSADYIKLISCMEGTAVYSQTACRVLIIGIKSGPHTTAYFD